MKYYLRIVKYLKPYLPSFFLSILLTLAFTTANVLFLPLTRDIVKEMANKNLVHFNNQILNAVLLYGIRIFSQFGQHYVMMRISNRIVIDIRIDLYRRLQEFSQHFYAERKLGDIISRLFNDTDKVRQAIMAIFWETLPQSLTLIAIVGYLIYLNWQLTLFALIAMPLFIAIIMYSAERLKKVARQVQRKSADITHIAQETLSNIKLVQAYTMEEKEIDRFERENVRSFNATMKGVAVQSTIEPLVSFLQFAVIAGVIWYGGYQMASGALSGPVLTSFFTGVFLLVDPVLALSKVYSSVQQSMASAERLFEIMDTPPVIRNAPNALKPDHIDGKVTFHHVTFSYHSDERNVLENISLTAKESEIIALVGLSGAGKSTLINLIPRFYDVTDGYIEIDGMDIRTIDIRTLRSFIAIVPQEDILFRGTILENIRYGRPDASQEEVEAAAAKANALEFIEKMPKGWLTKIGDRGIKLSGGQKQRISIARAILVNPRILILDEATSALDSESEALVQDALNNLMKNRTTFVIAHRLSTITHADKIIVLEDGRIIEQGTHKYLVRKNGAYRKLYDIQFGGTVSLT